MHIYQKYIIRSLFFPFVLCLIVIASIIWLTQLLKFLSLFDKGISITSFLEIVILFLPSIIHIIMPFSCLYSGLYVYNNLKFNKELLIYSSSGLSYRSLYYPLFKFTFLIYLFACFSSFYLLPTSFHKLKNSLSDFRTNYVNNFVHEGLFNNLSKNLILYVDKKINTNSFENLILLDFKNKNVVEIIIAKQGILSNVDNKPLFELYDGQRQSTNSNGDIEKLDFEGLMISVDPENKKLERQSKELMEMTIWELYQSTKQIGNKPNKYIGELNNRLSWPLFNIILPLVGISLFIRSEYVRKNYIKQLSIVFIICIGFVIAHFILVAASTKSFIWLILIYLNISIAIIISIINLNSGNFKLIK